MDELERRAGPGGSRALLCTQPSCLQRADVKHCSALLFPRLEPSLGLLSPSLPPLITPSPLLAVLGPVDVRDGHK